MLFGRVHPFAKLIFTKLIVAGCVKTNINLETHRLQKIKLKIKILYVQSPKKTIVNCSLQFDVPKTVKNICLKNSILNLK